jgi:hypothetical protein
MKRQWPLEYVVVFTISNAENMRQRLQDMLYATLPSGKQRPPVGCISSHFRATYIKLPLKRNLTWRKYVCLATRTEFQQFAWNGELTKSETCISLTDTYYALWKVKPQRICPNRRAICVCPSPWVLWKSETTTNKEWCFPTYHSTNPLL